MRIKTRFKILATCYSKKGKILSQSTNSYTKSHPLQAHFANICGMPNKIYLHAEIAAILLAGKNKIHHIKIERYKKNGDPANAEPCPICKAAIKSFGISEITYTTGATNYN